jgi:putative transposase
MPSFQQNTIVIRKDVPFRVVRFAQEKMQLENLVTGEFSSHDPDELLEEYMAGSLYTGPKQKHAKPHGATPENSNWVPAQASETDRIDTRRRIEYVTTLERAGAFSEGKAHLREEIFKLSLARDEPRPPDVTTVYRWRKLYKAAQNDVRALISKTFVRGGKDKSRLDARIELIIEEKIDEVYLTTQRGSAEDVHDAVFLAIEKINATLPPTQHLKLPGLRTIQRRIAALPAYDVAVARYGVTEANRRFAPILGARRATRILEIVEVDHTPVDLLVVDDERKVIGRPSITVVLDRRSRMVLGYHLSLAGHRTEAVFEAIRHALLPKTYLKSRFSDLELNWPCHGWFECFLMDNGREFHADAVVDALHRLGIPTEYAASKSPNDKAHVERFLKTFNYLFVHKLPGTTLAKVSDRIGRKAEEEACLTLEELDSQIHIWITSVYHNRKHKGLGWRTPLEIWSEQTEVNPPQLKANAQDVEIEFSRVSSRTLHHYGIEINLCKYASVELSQLRALLPPKTKVDIKWPWNDLGHIWVWNPITEDYLQVPNVDPTYDGLTYDQAAEFNKHLQQDPNLQRVRANGREAMREIQSKAMQDKELKGRRRGSRLANHTSKDLHREPPANPVDEEDVPSLPAPSTEDSDLLEPFETEGGQE